MQIRVTIGPTFSSTSYLDLPFQMMAIKYVTAMTSLIKSGTITTYAPLLPNVLKKDTLQVVPVFIASLIPGNNSPGFNWSSRQTAHWSAIFEQHSRPQSPHWRRQNWIGAGEDGSVSKNRHPILQRNFSGLRGFWALDGWILGLLHSPLFCYLLPPGRNVQNGPIYRSVSRCWPRTKSPQYHRS